MKPKQMVKGEQAVDSIPGLDAPRWFSRTQTPLPAWLTEIREHQARAVEQVVDAYRAGAKVVFLDAPVGSGKTLDADLVRRQVAERALYICSTKSLQDQVLADFEYARVLKGRANYPTQSGEFPAITCADCDKRGSGDEAMCLWCPNPYFCEYQIAKREAVSAELGVLNTAYALAEMNGPRSSFSGQRLVVVDEADLLEGKLMRHHELRISARRVGQMRVEVPKKGSHMTTIRAWLEAEVGPAMKVAMTRCAGDLEGKRERERWKRLAEQVDKVVAREDGWVRDSGDEERARGGLVLKPVHVADVARGVLWRHSEKWLLMSGTFISCEMEAEALGLEGLEGREDVAWARVEVPMTFPVENRPVYYCPVAKNTRKAEEEAKAKGGATPAEDIGEAVSKIVGRYEDQKVLVHTHSYAMAKVIVEGLRGIEASVITYTRALDRDVALEKFKAAEGGAVLVAASMDRGVDLKDDLARCVIVTKIPYPYLGDRQVSERLRSRGGDLWYRALTVRSLVQMTGRGVRSAEDYADSWVLDASFGKLLRENKLLLPGWFREAIAAVRVTEVLG